MNEILLAGVDFAAWTLLRWLTTLIIVGGAIGIAVVVLRWAKIKIPPPIIMIAWIVLVVVVGVVAIKFIASMI